MSSVASRVFKPSFVVADDRGSVRIVFADGALTISREEGHRLLFHGRPLEKSDVVLRLRGCYVVLERCGHYFSIAAWEMAGLFRRHRGLCLLRAEVGKPGGSV